MPQAGQELKLALRDTHPARNQGDGGLSLAPLSLVVAGQSGGHVVGRRLREPWLILVVKISCTKTVPRRSLSTSSRSQQCCRWPPWAPLLRLWELSPPQPPTHSCHPRAGSQKHRSTSATPRTATEHGWLYFCLKQHHMLCLCWLGISESHVPRSKWLLKLLVTGQQEGSKSHPSAWLLESAGKVNSLNPFK